jgi:hypothetical protein
MEIFGRLDHVLIGVVHLLPLPGSPDYAGGRPDSIYDRALSDARSYWVAGFDGLIVENHGDIPFAKPEDIGPETAAHGGRRRPDPAGNRIADGRKRPCERRAPRAGCRQRLWGALRAHQLGQRLYR